jgi:hypothetical protein
MSSIEGPPKLPRNPPAWEKKVSGYHNDVSNIHSLEVIKSASKIQEGQFLSLRVLWKPKEAKPFDLKKLGLASEYHNAGQFLKSLDSWKKYVNDIRDGTSTTGAAFPDLGTFTLVRSHQLEAARVSKTDDTWNAEFSPAANRTRSKARAQQGIEDSPLFGKGKGEDIQDLDFSMQNLDIGQQDESPSTAFSMSPIGQEAAAILYPATRDEQIVNAALLLFLQAVSIHKLRNPHWTLHRRIFKVEFPKGKLEARTDGFLDLNIGGESQVKAIVEVKPFVRQKNVQVRMQESAQMVAWIASEPDATIEPKKVKQYVEETKNNVFIFFDVPSLTIMQASYYFSKPTRNISDQCHLRQ